MSYKVLIVEDEPAAVDLLVDLISSDSNFKVMGIARNGKTAMEKINSSEFDLIFLDIMLPDMSGIDILKQIPDNLNVILTTAYSHFAVDAFELGVIDYLMKPIEKERFHVAIQRFTQTKKEKPRTSINEKGLFIKTHNKLNFIIHEKIVYISSNKKKCIIYTDSIELEANHLLGELELKLPASMFTRIHKQYLVNINYISHIEYFIHGKYSAYLKDVNATVLPVGRKYKNLLNFD
ncbi:MAG: response regulator transcription factor [Spirochaetota bacterium]